MVDVLISWIGVRSPRHAGIVGKRGDRSARHALCYGPTVPGAWSVRGAFGLTSVTLVTASKHPETTKTLPEQGFRVVRRQGFEPRTR